MKTGFKMIILLSMVSLNHQLFAQEERSEGNEFQENMPVEERASKRTERMKTELSLTTDQEKEIYAINLKHMTQMDKYREEQKALREKMQAEKEANRTEIKKVLSPEQNVIFDQKMSEQEQKKEEHRKNTTH